MAKIDISMTELVCPGKYNEDNTLKEVPRVSLPFHVIETVNESHAAREAQAVGNRDSPQGEGRKGISSFSISGFGCIHLF